MTPEELANSDRLFSRRMDSRKMRQMRDKLIANLPDFSNLSPAPPESSDERREGE